MLNRVRKKKKSAQVEAAAEAAQEGGEQGESREGELLRKMVDEYLAGPGKGRGGVIDLNDENLPLEVKLALMDTFTPEDYEMLLTLDESIDRSLPLSDFASIPQFTPSPSTPLPYEDCLICHCSLTHPSSPLGRPFCGHVFHRQCLETWLTGYHHCCPVCKTSLKNHGAKSAKGHVVRRPPASRKIPRM
eukprot:TRINITY_DN7232_c1_g1_i2.p1 TRINITY_DN7232_c1_g1~~TRINITY_DN7232_c1_g1_i2.p1  ORF type:complete len:189 (+),score=21.73 TRINITY_DN7232_c1_g1_i2:142-708(+)